MCFSDGDEEEKINLAEQPFEKIKIKFNKNEQIEFVDNKWNPYIKANNSINVNQKVKKSTNPHSQEDVDNLKKEIEQKDKKIEELEEKIKKVEEKIDTLKNILKIDVGEQLYLQDLLKQEEKNINENGI